MTTVAAPPIAQCYWLTGLKLGLTLGIAMLESRIEPQTPTPPPPRARHVYGVAPAYGRAAPIGIRRANRPTRRGLWASLDDRGEWVHGGSGRRCPERTGGRFQPRPRLRPQARL